MPDAQITCHACDGTGSVPIVTGGPNGPATIRRRGSTTSAQITAASRTSAAELDPVSLGQAIAAGRARFVQEGE